MRTNIFTKILVIMFCILISFSFITPVFAGAYDDIPKNRTLIVKSNIDPRVSAEGLSITIIFMSKVNGYQETITLSKSNNYTVQIKTINSEFQLFTGMVSNDVMGNYGVRCDDFDKKKATTTIEIEVGNPEYAGEVIEKENVVGDIDRETTNALREQHGMTPIDWDEIDRQIANGEFDIDKWIEEKKEEYKDAMIDKGYITEDVDIEKWDTDGDGTPNYYDDDDDNDGITDVYDENILKFDEPKDEEKPTIDKDNDGDIDEDDAKIEQEEKKEEEKQKEEEEKKSKNIAFIFVGGMIAIFAISLYFKNKYSDIE
jgi:hypothetical protein